MGSVTELRPGANRLPGFSMVPRQALVFMMIKPARGGWSDAYRLCYLALLARCGGNPLFVVGHKLLARDTGLTVETARRTAKALVDLGVMEHTVNAVQGFGYRFAGLTYEWPEAVEIQHPLWIGDGDQPVETQQPNLLSLNSETCPDPTGPASPTDLSIRSPSIRPRPTDPTRSETEGGTAGLLNSNSSQKSEFEPPPTDPRLNGDARLGHSEECPIARLAEPGYQPEADEVPECICGRWDRVDAQEAKQAKAAETKTKRERAKKVAGIKVTAAKPFGPKGGDPAKLYAAILKHWKPRNKTLRTKDIGLAVARVQTCCIMHGKKLCDKELFYYFRDLEQESRSWPTDPKLGKIAVRSPLMLAASDARVCGYYGFED